MAEDCEREAEGMPEGISICFEDPGYSLISWPSPLYKYILTLHVSIHF